MIIGTMDLKIKSGFKTPILAIPTPLLAVPYEAPRLAKTRAEAIPMYPKKEAELLSETASAKIASTIFKIF